MKKEKELLMYCDQYGYKYYAKTLKELKQAVCPYTSHPRVAIMYKDKKDGSVVRCGYVVSHHWLTAFKPYEVKI